MSSVKKVWHDDENFCVELAVDGLGVVYAFPIKELSAGASLSRLMTIKVRETVDYNGWMVDPELLRAAGRLGVSALREYIEPYFEARGAAVEE